MKTKSSPTAYGTIAIGLHWITAVLIIALMMTGMIAEDTADPVRKAMILSFHAPLGISVAILTLARLIWWWRFDTRPEPSNDSPAWQQKLATSVHALLYVVILGMAASGIGMFVLTGAGDVLFGNAPGPLPDFEGVTPRIPHGIGAKLLIALLVAHVGAALFHHFIRRDDTLARMWYARS